MRYGKPSDAELRNPNTRLVFKMPASSTDPEIGRPLYGSFSAGDPQQLAVDMSVSLWSSLNPGYMRQEPAKVCSVAKADYAWDTQEVRLPGALITFQSAKCYVQRHMARIFCSNMQGMCLNVLHRQNCQSLAWEIIALLEVFIP